LTPLRVADAPVIGDVISDLPSLRSGLSKEPDSYDSWLASITSAAGQTAAAVTKMGDAAVAANIQETVARMRDVRLERGSNWAIHKRKKFSKNLPDELRAWYSNNGRTNVVVNHDTRGHMSQDLQRYLFCSCFSSSIDQRGRGTPKREDFPKILYPNHRSWESGAFADRFRVQARKKVATTITSHISKDGHYFIHYDPTQCRSLTVREAARTQTFPDNYFFVGNRTQQYVQVGNAVPPFLARQLAEVVFRILT